jgi:hypothetical protein
VLDHDNCPATATPIPGTLIASGTLCKHTLTKTAAVEQQAVHLNCRTFCAWRSPFGDHTLFIMFDVAVGMNDSVVREFHEALNK